ncbi:MAG: hypothetical protein Q8909_05135 [Bacteroidota bacterium]|nr:hypothetical protein [Bacteroidota bacterium]
MRNISNINIGESVRRRKLILNEPKCDNSESIMVYITFGTFIFFAFIGLVHFNFTNTDESNLIVILPIGILIFSVYIIYRKATENHLLKIKTPYNDVSIKQLLLEYSNNGSYEIYLNTNDCLILNETDIITDITNSPYRTTIIILIEDNAVYFTVVKDQIKLNIPVLFTHYIILHDLKKLLNARS